MYTLCSTEKTADQQRIFEKTFLQMLLESNYDDITISELCRRAGLSRRIFYRLFERKSDVLYALLDHTILEEESYEPDESVGTGDLPRFFAFWKEQKDLLDALLKHKNCNLLTDQAVRYLYREPSPYAHLFGADKGNFQTETMVYYVSGIFSVMLAWHAQGYPHSIDEMAQLMQDLWSTVPYKQFPFTK